MARVTDAGRGQSIPPDMRARLAAYFPDLDLDAVRLHEGVPRYVPGRPRGYTSRTRIHLVAGWRSDTSVEMLALVAHELVHVRQYRDLGTWRFRWAYVREYVAGRFGGLGHDAAYRNISFERAARDVEERVRRDFRGGVLRA